MKYWLDKGVAGFRMDAVPYLVEDSEFKDEEEPGQYTKDLDGSYDIIYDLREYLDEYSKANGGDER